MRHEIDVVGKLSCVLSACKKFKLLAEHFLHVSSNKGNNYQLFQ